MLHIDFHYGSICDQFKEEHSTTSQILYPWRTAVSHAPKLTFLSLQPQQKWTHLNLCSEHQTSLSFSYCLLWNLKYLPNRTFLQMDFSVIWIGGFIEL